VEIKIDFANMVELSALSAVQKLVFEPTTTITWMHCLRRIGSNVTARCKRQHRASVSSKGDMQDGSKKKEEKKKILSRVDTQKM
jgi:hypothetical protein